MSRRLETGDLNRGGGGVPAHSGRLGALVHSSMVALRGRRLRAIDQMELVAMILTLSIVADQSTTGDAKDLAGLLASSDARGDLGRTVTGRPLIGVGIGLKAEAEILSSDDVQVLFVVGVEGIGLTPGRVLVECGQAIPRNALLIGGVLSHKKEYAAVNASFIQTLADLIPLKFIHCSFLLVSNRV